MQAALEISRAEGLPAVTMRAVATRFEVTPMALYRHITDRPTLVRLVADRIGTLVRPGAPADAEWDARVRAWAQAQRSVLRAHPGTAAWLIANGPSGPEAYRLLEYLASALVDARLDDARVARGTALVMSWTFSRISIEDQAQLTRPQSFVEGLETVDAVKHPIATRIGPEFFTLAPEVVFETGLDWIIAGLTAEGS